VAEAMTQRDNELKNEMFDQKEKIQRDLVN